MRQHLLNAVKFNALAVSRNVADITHEESLTQGPGGSSSMNWILGHLIFYRGRITGMLGGTPVWPEGKGATYSRGSKPDAGTAHPWGELLSDWVATEQALVAAIEAASNETLAEGMANPGLPFLGPHTTRAHIAAALFSHETYHVGQLGTLRRALGKPAGIA